MKKSTNLIAFLIAFSLHVLLGGLLLMNIDFSLPKEKPKEAVSIIDASLVSQKMFDDLAERKTKKKLLEQRKKDDAQKKKEREKADRKRKELEKKRKDALIKKQKLDKIKAEKADAARKEKEAKRVAAEKMLAEKKLKQKKADEKRALAKKKALAKEKEAEKIKAEKIKAEKVKAEKEKAEKVKAEKAKAEKAKAEKVKAEKAKAEKERLRQSELDKQMEAEFSNDFSNARSAKQLSEIAKYEALIRKKISRHWKVDPSMSGKSCTLGIRLAPDGLVISANMSRGDKKLCNSARRATLQAKTLPIPKDPELAPQFRDFDITLEPEL